MTKIFKTPFAETGDKISPPDAVQPDGSVSYAVGYGFDYQRDTSLDGGVPVDPLAKVFPREQHNGILNDITTAIGEIQANGLTIWQSIGGPYPINALVRHSGSNWRSTVANNATTPGALGASWIDISYQPNASETVFGLIRIATQAEVDGGENDSASVTPKKLAEKIKQATESSLGVMKISTTALATAGVDDSTAMTPAKTRAAVRATTIGAGQTLQNVIGSRSLGTAYTNSTGRPIQVMVSMFGGTGSETAVVNISGFVVYTGDPGYGTTAFFSFTVLNGQSYMVDVNPKSGANLVAWAEVR